MPLNSENKTIHKCLFRIMIFVFVFSFLTGRSEAKSGFIEWLKCISEIRGQEIVLYYPHGKIFRKDPLVFRWSYDKNPDHFVIRVMEESEDVVELGMKEIWVSDKIPGDIRSYETAMKFEKPYYNTYYWQVEIYEKNSTIPNLKNKQYFSFFFEREATQVREKEKVVLGWIHQRPTEEHLLLLLGSYYASQHMFFHSRRMFGDFLKKDDHTVYSYQALTTLLLNQLSQIEKTRASLKTGLVELNSKSGRIKTLSELLRLNLILLDYNNAIRCVDELIALSEEDPEDIIFTWQQKKKIVITEKKIVDETFPDDSL